ncbi:MULTISPECIES: glycosyltransferase family 2 protein [Streptomyces]|uniref:Glycosyltransferase n=3 Tax=Streptomyces TaxID=1883 RepID=A0A420UZ46_9ACTN|nr:MULTISPECIES: glycosyltransferase [Streptomyces]KNE78658.1 transferase [Streptomyces fradiae]PQM21837.1 transferase [Streptomyces xinghaiensis]RKM93269.1 glycosyltransferase [Streptomyces xinghaiensis]RNC71133.1 glycosyltransferase [Streptomyces xinghaiensis]
MSGSAARNAGTPGDPEYAVVIPTLGRPSLGACLRALAAAVDAGGPAPRRIVLVDDRPPYDCAPLAVDIPDRFLELVRSIPGSGSGPAAARNTGWATAPEPWIVFLDDDVLPGPRWAADLAADLAAAGPATGGIQARITVPLPRDRPPTDWERNTAGLATSQWITADMAYRRTALEALGGFDERFPRAFREDADLALRALDAGWTLTMGSRRTTHPVRPAGRWVSVRAQAGNADDVLMNRLHGRAWWARAGAPRGRLPRHLAVTAAGAGALALAAAGRPRAAAVSAALWLAGTAEFAAARVLPGPRTPDEITTMALTSTVIPPVAAWHWARGLLRHRREQPRERGAPPPNGAGHADRERMDGPVR